MENSTFYMIFIANGGRELLIFSTMSIVCPLRHSMPASSIFLFSYFIAEKTELKRQEASCLIHKGLKWQSHNLSLDEDTAFLQSGESLYFPSTYGTLHPRILFFKASLPYLKFT